MQPNTQNQPAKAPVPDPVVNGKVPETKPNPVDILTAKIAELEAKLAAASKPKEIKSNPNKFYTFDRKRDLPAAVKTTQVIALAKIVKSLSSDKVSEPDLFAALNKAAAEGRLNTTQPPASIFRYYKSHLAAASILIGE